VREATVDDADAIARVHVDSWRGAYRGLVPDSVLDGLSVERRAEGWREWLAPDRATRRNIDGLGRIIAAARTWVAEREDRIVGFVNAGPSRESDVANCGEVYAIYVLPEAWDNGVGAALMNAAVSWLRTRYAGAMLWVLAGNDRGRAFYEKGGWGPDGSVQKLDFDGIDLDEVRYRIDFGPGRTTGSDV